MPAWKGGFDGTTWNKKEFQKEVDKLKVPSWVKGITLHHSAAPYTIPPVAISQRLKNLGHYYKNEKRWSSGPHLFTYENGVIGKGTPLTQKGVHATSFNSSYWGLEMEGFFDKGRHNPEKSVDIAAWVFATLLKKAKLPANTTTIKFHRDDPRTRKTCPGTAVDKAKFIALVQKYMDGEESPVVNDPVVRTTDFVDVGRYQERLIQFGYDLGKWGADGDKGPVTKAAINKFQKDRGLPVSDIVSEEMWKLLEKVPNADVPGEVGSAKEIQKRLIAHGYDLGKWGADGVIGPVTVKAIKEFQNKMGVDLTGVVGPWIWMKLQQDAVTETDDDQPDAEPVVEEKEDEGKAEAPVDETPVVEEKLEETADPNSLRGRDRPLYVKRVLMDYGWTDFQAAAIVGQLMRESYPDLRTHVWGDKGTAYGIAQWRLDRLEGLKKFAAERGQAIDDLRAQAHYVHYELLNNERGAGRALKASTNLVEALRAAIGYERPAGWTRNNPERGDGWKERMVFAQSLL